MEKELIPEKTLGTMGSDPSTGECFAVFAGAPLPAESAELMAQGALLERRPLNEIKETFCEIDPSRRIALFGSSIGVYLGRDIPEWHEMADGTRYHYVGVCGSRPDLDSLAPGQTVLAPGLIYQRQDSV